MVERFLAQTSFASQEDFIKNLKINVPENFNFGYDVVDAWAAEQPDKNALLWTNDQGESRQFSFADMKRYTDMTASYFQSLGIGRGDMVMLILKRRYEFWYSTIALHKLGATVIPATHLLTKKDIIYRCNAADIKMIVAAGEGIILQHIKDALPECPSVEKLVSVGPEVPEGFEDFHQGIDNAAPFIRPRHANTNDDISLMYFTSGTTGEPKGAVLPHSCFDAAMEIHHERLDTLSDRDTSVSFLPMSHIFEKAWTYFCLDSGMRVDINSNPKEIQVAVRIAQPTCMCSVPRFWEKVYTAIQEKMGKMKGLQKIMVEKALKVGARRNLDYVRLGLNPPRLLEMQYRFFDNQVFSKLRRAIGIANGNIFPTAGAPLSSTIVEFLHTCGINIVIGYGLSETTATVTCFPDVGYEIGSVGTVMPRVQIKLGAENEILVKGPTVMRGYYNRPEENAKVFTPDGWLRTGDAGLIDHSGSLVLTERLKDLFKTSNGKYIAPQAIESRLGEDRYIEQVAVIGDKRKYVTAIIIPAFEALKEYARSKGISFSSIDDLVQNSEIRRFIGERIEKLQKGLAGFEKIKKFTLLPKEFTIENGELTNTLKIRRPAINAIYADDIEAMYC